MDPVLEIKARLSIEELVGQYCQLQKKGRGFVCVCPFHKDTHPSMQVSPDKGIAYCFACSSGGDVFSFYQKIEGVDFRQALKDLAEKAGVELPKEAMTVKGPKKDEKDRMRDCLLAAQRFYQHNLKENKKAIEYLKERKMPAQQVVEFGMGVSPDSFSATYEFLLKEGFSKSEILGAGLGVQKDLAEGKIYDRFRNRLMFPIYDGQGNLVGFGGRTLGEDDAKYINSAEGPLYHKSKILYGLHYAKEEMREQKKVIMVEGYFDVIACHRIGMKNVIAVSGTALTEEHVKILARTCESVLLCLDQDRAGKAAAERAFHLLSKEGLLVEVVSLEQKDPDEAANADPEGLKKILASEGQPYIEHVLQEIAELDLSSVQEKRGAMQRLLPLIQSIQTATEKSHYLTKAAGLFGTTETALKEDLAALPAQTIPQFIEQQRESVASTEEKKEGFNSQEIALGLFLLYPHLREALGQLIEPDDMFAAALYKAIKEAPESKELTPEILGLPEELSERITLLQLYCEHHDMREWSDSLALREIRKNCTLANREHISAKQRAIAKKISEARREGKTAEIESLNNEYLQVLKLAKMAS